MDNLKTKIVATVGPSSIADDVIRNLLQAGVTVPRFNVKHNELHWHSKYIDRYRDIAKHLNKNIGILLDLQGPSLRTGVFQNNVQSVNLKEGEVVYFSIKKDTTKGNCWIPFPQIDLVTELQPGAELMLDDGTIIVETIEHMNGIIKGKVKVGGSLANTKSINIPQAKIELPSMTEKDKKYVKMAVEKNVDFIALSFVRSKEDLLDLKELISQNSGNQKVITKFETAKAIENIDEVIEHSDAIMIARGDLGIEIPFEQVPEIQQRLITKCREVSKQVIVATQMVKSMADEPIPSRAEVSDVTLAIKQKTDAVMLSEETTVGKFPVKAVEAMARIAIHNENYTARTMDSFRFTNFEDSLISAAYEISRIKPEDSQDFLTAIIIFTFGGKSARSLSRFRPPLPIHAFTHIPRVHGSLALSWGVTSHLIEFAADYVENIKKAIDLLKDEQTLKKGDRVLIVFGNNIAVPSANNSLTIEVVK